MARKVIGITRDLFSGQEGPVYERRRTSGKPWNETDLARGTIEEEKEDTEDKATLDMFGPQKPKPVTIPKLRYLVGQGVGQGESVLLIKTWGGPQPLGPRNVQVWNPRHGAFTIPVRRMRKEPSKKSVVISGSNRAAQNSEITQERGR